MAKSKREKKRQRVRDCPDIIVTKRWKTVLTNEDWYPSTNFLLDVSVIGRKDSHTTVQVWGGDDFGMYIYGNDWARAVREFDRIVHLTTQAELWARGFRPL